MGVITANLEKLRSLLKEGWKFESLSMQHLSPSWRTTVVLKRGKGDLTLQSDEDEFFRFCVAHKRFFDENGDPMFRRVADLGRYHAELEVFARQFDVRKKQSLERLKAGEIRLTYVPEMLIAEFLKSRNWGDPKYLPLKSEYFDILLAILWRSKEAADAEERLFAAFPESKPYALRIGEVLRSSFDPFKEPLRNYLRFADLGKKPFVEVAKKLLDESKLNNDMFARLTKDSPVEGQIGLRYLIDMYRRYAEWVLPLLKILSEAVCALEGKPAPDPSLGMTKRVELVRQTAYAGIVDCFDPRIRHAASHGGVSYDQDLGIVKFDGLDSEGVRRFDDFELSYAEIAEKTRYFLRGFAPGMLSGFGMQEQLQLLTTINSGEYRTLLLFIGNEASD
jgi:hypothetical protein